MVQCFHYCMISCEFGCLSSPPYSHFPLRLPRSHLLTIVPLLIMSKDQDSLDALETSLGTDIVAMVTAAIPQTLIHILPLFAASKASQSDSASQRAVVKKVTRANAAYEFMEKIVKKEVEIGVWSS